MFRPLVACFAAAVSLCAADRPVLQLSLQRAIEISTSPEGSNRLQLANELTEQAKARSSQARAALLPSIDGAVTEENLNQNLTAFGLNLNIPIPGFQFPHIVGPFNLFDPRLPASPTVFDFGSIRRLQSSRMAGQ